MGVCVKGRRRVTAVGRRVSYLRQAEVRDLDIAVFIEQDVAGLEVVVDDCASPVLSLALRDGNTPG